MNCLLILAAAALTFVLGAMSPRPVLALSASLDADGDGFTDAIETVLGSDPHDPTSTPESVALPPTCLDGIDNDKDGKTDLADPKCHAPAPSMETFPPAGRDVFDSRMSLDDYVLVTTRFGTCRVSFEGRGPTVVQRSAPVDLGGGLRQIDVEIVALQISGTATVMPGAGCTLPPGNYPVTVVEDPAQRSVGKVTDTNADPAKDFPADSFFDVFFKIDTPAGVIDGSPPNGTPGTPVHVENTLQSIPPYHTGDNPLCYRVAGLAHQHCPKAPPDHFKCYTGKFPRSQPQPVTLIDQFGTAQTTVTTPLLFCNPAAKNGEPLFDRTDHLKCYKIKGEKVRRTVQVRNQFGLETIQVRKSILLCVPSQKDQLAAPQDADHFQCYTGRFPRFRPKPVTLVDQFGTEQTKVLAPVLLCNPVSKNGEPVFDPLNHLKCYRIKPRRVRQTITVTNQFGSERVGIKKAALLCVPSAKFEPGPTTTTTTTIRSTTTTTTTTIPFKTTLMTGYMHVVVGQSSIVCGKASTTPPQAGATGTAQLTRPDGTMATTEFMLDASGVGRFQFPINQFGGYGVDVMVNSTAGTGTASGTVDVTQTQSSCP